MNADPCIIFYFRYDCFVTKAENTKVYEFALVNDTESKLLTKKMTEYPLLVQRDGKMIWNGVIRVKVNCAMEDIDEFPFDEQECPMKWIMVPTMFLTKVKYIFRRSVSLNF